MIIPAADLSRADLHRRHRGLGHRQHEVRAERRADHRHLDGANIEMAQAWARTNIFIFGLRADAGRATCARHGYQPRQHVRARTRAAAARARRDRRRRVLARRAGPLPRPDRLAAERRPLPAAGRLRPPTCQAQDARRRAVPRPGRLGARASSRTSPAWARFSSDRTIREYVEQVWSRPDGRDGPSRRLGRSSGAD